jgi:hypothetical protein
MESIGELVYELNSTPRWSKLTVASCTCPLYELHGDPGATMSLCTEQLRDVQL